MDGYYNYLLTFIDKAVDDGFIKPSQRHIIVSAPNAKELVQKLEVGLEQITPSFFSLPFLFLFLNLGLKHKWKRQSGDEERESGQVTILIFISVMLFPYE